ncbi:MAG TPA: hypothetical protein VNA14_11335 [Mycobacteriales bacterium]|nr:hypothetical protein [Mycobacteriales bacterium]
MTVPVEAYIRVRLKLLPTGQGGRRTPIRSGYRCDCWLGGRAAAGDRGANGAVLFLEDREKLSPGESSMARLQPGVEHFWNGIYVDMLIELGEGTRLIGKATVEELLRR